MILDNSKSFVLAGNKTLYLNFILVLGLTLTLLGLNLHTKFFDFQRHRVQARSQGILNHVLPLTHRPPVRLEDLGDLEELLGGLGCGRPILRGLTSRFIFLVPAFGIEVDVAERLAGTSVPHACDHLCLLVVWHLDSFPTVLLCPS